MSKRKSTVQARTEIPAKARALLLAGGAVHIVYGLGSLLMPERMVSAHYALSQAPGSSPLLLPCLSSPADVPDPPHLGHAPAWRSSVQTAGVVGRQAGLSEPHGACVCPGEVALKRSLW